MKFCGKDAFATFLRWMKIIVAKEIEFIVFWSDNLYFIIKIASDIKHFTFSH